MVAERRQRGGDGMSRGITFSPNHGVNPMIPICVWCGEEKNEIALLGKLPGDAEAPRSAVIDFEPCDTCAEHMAMGVIVIEVTEKQVGNLPPFKAAASPGPVYLTGRWSVVSDKGAHRMFDQFGWNEEQRTVCLDVETYEHIGFVAEGGSEQT